MLGQALGLKDEEFDALKGDYKASALFTDREKVFDIVEAVCGGRMHPNWFRIGGVAQDLPDGWQDLVRRFINYFPKRLREYDNMVMRNSLFKARTVGIGIFTAEEAIDYGLADVMLERMPEPAGG